MSFAEYFPVWDKLDKAQQKTLLDSVTERSAKAGTVLYTGGSDCLGLVVVKSGRLRAYSLSGEGREITLYRLFERDICLMTSSCMMHNLQFDVTIEVEKDAEFWVVPPAVYRTLTEQSLAAARYTNDLLATRLSDVMWLMEQIMWQSFDKRLAEFLLEESALENTTVLNLTHEKIANHLGTAREVVTRMLRYFQGEGMVRLARGTVELTDPQALARLADAEKPSK